METFKITSIFFFTLCLISHAQDPSALSIEDATDLYIKNHTELHQITDKQKLTIQSQQAKKSVYLPKLDPLKLSYDLANQTADASAGLKWQLPTGSTIHAQAKQSLGTEDLDQLRDYQETPFDFQQPTQYQLSISHDFTTSTKGKEERLAKINLEIEALNLKDRYEKQILTFRKKYREVLLQSFMMEQQTAQAESLKAMVEHHKLQLEHGEISPLEYKKSLSNLERKAIDLLKQEREYNLSLIQLKQMMGLSYDSAIALDDQITFNTQIITPKDAIQQAYSYNRPYAISLLEKASAQLKYHIYTQKQRPSLSLEASADQDLAIQAKVNFSMSVKDAESEYQAAEAGMQFLHHIENAQLQEDNLKTQIHSDLIQLNYLKSLLDVTVKELQQQQTIFKAESIKLDYQAVSAEEFETAQQNLNQAYHDSMQTQIQFANAKESFYQSIGLFDSINMTTESTDE